jgi:rhodanese-related sulfurtransferase
MHPGQILTHIVIQATGGSNTQRPGFPAMNYFEQKLAHETDAADVAAALGSFTLVDARSEAAYDAAHLPGALSLARDELPDGPLVVYCWSPGCNGATKACARLIASGRSDVKEMIGGFEYWVREGYDVVGEPRGLVGLVG